MTSRKGWTREQLLVAFRLYCQIPFGKLHSRNPEIIRYSNFIGRTPSALAMKLSNIASLDPAITSTGRKGLAGASLADKKMWDEMQNNWESFVVESENIMAEVSQNEGEFLQTEKVVDYTGQSKLVQTRVRIGQQFFRKTVLSAYDGRCCITGLSHPQLLVASHIIPWKDDESIRLNPRNGLALSMLHDKAFDLGMITIDANMRVVVSQKYSVSHDPFFNATIQRFAGKEITLPEKFEPDGRFLEYHRTNIFEKDLT
jgi:predicted restriction endonuclease